MPAAQIEHRRSIAHITAMIQFLREMFAANRIIVLFVYGQAFFVLALAIALRSWRHSRLELARTLAGCIRPYACPV